MKDDPVGAFLKAVEAAAIDEIDVYAEDAVLDATVPNWRFKVEGSEAIRAQYAKWFSEPTTFVELRRFPLPDGEFVAYEVEWVDAGVRTRTHHAHHVVVRDGKVTSDTVWCGGPRPEETLLAEVEAAKGEGQAG